MNERAMLKDFPSFFRCVTASASDPGGRAPYPYQVALAEQGADLIEIPTGLGKTDAVAAAWLWNRYTNPATTPRRLIYSLPMRSLVEQTAARIRAMLEQLDRAALDDVPGLQIAMGGDVGDEWFENPERPSVLVGTQDMLLSRALNRGYAMSRFQWAMSFGAINNDVLWIIDEVQLQGVGAVTAAQLQGLREKLGTIGPARTQFMSATLDRAWLDTVDHPLGHRATLTLSEEDFACEPVRRIVSAQKTIARLEERDEASIARAIHEVHRAGTLTLTVVNTVERARTLHRHLQRLATGIELVLLHSRFRPADRAAHLGAISASIDAVGGGRIVIATQVVEAGIDIDAATLITDVAPWSSVVQRLGRCNRRGSFETASVYWLDSGEPTEKSALPYELDEIRAARAMLASLEGKSGNSSALPKLPIELGSGLVLRRVDLFDLFDTSPDLAGHDVDVSRFIREADDFTASVFWRDQAPAHGDPPHRDELCPASLSDVRRLLKRLAEQGRRQSARVANQFGSDGKGHGPALWVPLDERTLRPGMQIWLHRDVGWYDPQAGFGDANARVEPVIVAKNARGFNDECTSIDGDRGSAVGAALTLSQHARDTADEARRLAAALNDRIEPSLAASIIRAALWHDVGKAHAVFQKTMLRGNSSEPPPGDFWAKSLRLARHDRPGFRHELASALAFLNAHGGDDDVSLVAFLIAAHHGKLRVSAQPLPSDVAFGSLLGVRDGESIPTVDLDGGESSPEFVIKLSPFRVGSSDSELTWVDRATALRDDPSIGPFRLGFYELLVRVSDWRASQRAAKPLAETA